MSPVPASAAARVRFDSVEKSFAGASRSEGERRVLRDVTLDVAPGEVIAILGTSGCGKSTLLRIVGGLDGATGGAVRLDEQSIVGIDERTAIGFQEPRLLPWRTVTQNVALGLPQGTPAAAGRERVARLISLVGLEDFADHRPREISGGMAQRTSLARALARTPGVLLLDEPFGALDALTKLRMQDLLLSIHEAEPATILLVTHDVDEALQLADRVIVLGHEEGISGATIIEELTVPGTRPRDRGSAELAELRGRLLSGLGIDRHGSARGIETEPGIPIFPY
ncbi:ABC transporter ATP-binding protein [Mycetocola tolaasinivorans]|uniref:ABC transporter ATP-binding protein n=1 Tax=Mycetocola tolaasinivorans TaxID=76635 RepID=A0A3L7A9T0_9MICO|nr:ABC transporter ATP-binding protein [Mycetocola tolaasinivorans]RLP76785.1 ABC transporter ATP-binding protein [Mycetocola tolaasinivorans]